MTRPSARAVRALGAGLLLATLTGCVYYNTLYLGKRYYNRSLNDVPYALDKSDLTPTPQFTRSIDLSKKVISMYPKSKYVDDAYVLWAKNLIGNDDPREAIRMLEEFDTSHPKSKLKGDAKFYLGVAYVRARKYEAALRTLDTYLEKYPKHGMMPYAYYERSRALLALERPGDAAASVGQVIDHYSKNKLLAQRARVQRAEAFMAQKDFDRARQDFRYLGERAQSDDERFAYMLREEDCLEGADKYDEAMALLRDALAHTREPVRSDTTGGRTAVAPTGPGTDYFGRLMLRVGSVHLRAGRLDEALASYQRVIEDYPRAPLAAEAQYRIGYAYETGAGDFDRARLEYAKVRDQGGGGSFGDQAAARVATIDRLSAFRKSSGDTLERAAEGDFLLAEQFLFQLDRPDRALEQYRKIEQQYAGTQWAAKAINAQGWVLGRKLKQTASADSMFWRVVHEHPGTEAQLAARDFLEADGVTVPVELIKLPETVYTHEDSLVAQAAVARAESLDALPKIPEGSMPLGSQGDAGGDSLKLGLHPGSFSMSPVVVSGDSLGAAGDSSGVTGTGHVVVPPVAPADTAVAQPDTTHSGVAPQGTSAPPSTPPQTTSPVGESGTPPAQSPAPAPVPAPAPADTARVKP